MLDSFFDSFLTFGSNCNLFNIHNGFYIAFILFLAGTLSGLVDAIVGCGSMITVPAMFLLGIPPHIAIGTNKVQGTFGTFYSSYCFYKKGLLKPKNLIKIFLFVLLFSFIGAIAVKLTPDKRIENILPIISIVLLIYKIKNFNHGLEDRHDIKVEQKKLMIFFTILVGFYDGFLGPASGTIWISILVAFFGYNLLRASASSKMLNLAGNLGGLPIFLLSGTLSYTIAIIMIVGQIIGTRIGVHLSIKHGAKFINIIFIAVVFILTILLLLNTQIKQH